MKRRKYSQWKFGVVLGAGALIALALCVQCVRTYLYADAVLIPQEAEHEAQRQAGALSAAARSAGISDGRRLGPVVERTLEAASDRVLWLRVLNLSSDVIAQAGSPEGRPRFPQRWWERLEKHERLGTSVDTQRGKALVVMLPLRLPRPPRGLNGSPGPPDERHTAYVMEAAISLQAVAGALGGLRQNLILGMMASIALLVSVAAIGLQAPHYFRGKYLEGELQLAKRVQSDLQPKHHTPVSPQVEFAVRALAADHVGGDFYDIFEVEPGKVAIVLGDVSGKGASAALLASVLQGAIRSSTAPQHEVACERINRMLCERTACERFATMFWGVFDTESNELRYVNAGHGAPMLARRDGRSIERLHEGGGPVLGLLPNALYVAGTAKIQDGDRLIVYSDGITEAANAGEEEFGDARLAEVISARRDEAPEALCGRIADEVAAFASSDVAQDDRTLMVVQLNRKAGPAPSREVAGITAMA